MFFSSLRVHCTHTHTHIAYARASGQGVACRHDLAGKQRRRVNVFANLPAAAVDAIACAVILMVRPFHWFRYNATISELSGNINYIFLCYSFFFVSISKIETKPNYNKKWARKRKTTQPNADCLVTFGMFSFLFHFSLALSPSLFFRHRFRYRSLVRSNVCLFLSFLDTLQNLDRISLFSYIRSNW